MMDSLELRHFIQERFRLSFLPAEEDSLYRLAEESVAAMAAMPPDDLKKAELESGCSGASTPAIKKVLLLIAIRKKWNLKLPDDTASLLTVSDLLQLTDANPAFYVSRHLSEMEN